MDINQAKTRIEALKREIWQLNEAYFLDNQELVPESVRDSLKRELIQLESAFPSLITLDSPSQQVGVKLDERLQKNPHWYKKESLADVFSFEEIQDWEDRLHKIVTQPLSYIVELKIDGLNITLQYEKGVLQRALTRGDGQMGEDVSHTILRIPEIPARLKIDWTGEISGEVFFKKTDFAPLKEQFANARNAAAGTVRQLDTRTSETRRLSFCPYAMFAEDLSFINSQSQLLEFLAEQGFSVAPHWKVCADLSEVRAWIKDWTDQRADLDFEIDGMVIKVDDKSWQKTLGSTAKTPRWAVAYKFPAEISQSQILSIDWQLGRTGVLTPVANLRPTLLAGSQVSRATLHNFEEIERKDVREGDTVMIYKAGDIIPAVLAVIKEMRGEDSQAVSRPEICPICNSKLAQNPEEVAIRCVNPDCPGVLS
ncbi:MAG TPA: NAD-dependent DNA ligase LigA, partial [Candidatus Gracilibacteria bacterium]|nr:NAD-dependent DNA ligase LigA [Candidatus Gracilibacteria bacterium]